MTEKTDTPEWAAQVAAAQRLVDGWVKKGYLVRMTDGRLIEADRYNPTFHGPKDELD